MTATDTGSTEGPLDLGLLSQDDVKFSRPDSVRPFVWGAVAVAANVVVAAVLVFWIIADRRETFRVELERRLSVFVSSREEILSTWLTDQNKVLDPLVTSDVFRLFLTEIAVYNARQQAGEEAGATGIEETLAQSAYLQLILEDFISGRNFEAGHIVDAEGRLYITSTRTANLFDFQLDAAARAVAERKTIYTPARVTLAGLTMDMAVPIYPPQPLEGETEVVPVGALIVTLPIQERLSAILERHPLARAGEQILLLQRDGDAWSLIDPMASPAIAPATFPEAAFQSLGQGMARVVSPRTAAEVYATLAQVEGPSWYLVQEAAVADAEQELNDFEIGIVVAVMGGLLLILGAFGIFWFRLSSDHNKTLAQQFQGLAQQINKQRKLLNGITNTMMDLLGLKDAEGHYTFVNPAFCRAVNKAEREILGLKDDAIFGFGTAQRLTATDRIVLDTRQQATTNEQIYLQAKLHHFQIAKVPFVEDEGLPVGVLAVSRDITELVEAVERRERAIREAVEAFSRAIELRDPYLVGHSRRVAGFAVAVGRRLELGDNEINTIELAARLAQIGKLAIPSAILRKETRLTDEEIAIVQSHVEHAVSILRKVDFDLPVAESVHKMYERLDGTGYPRNLSGDQIELVPRILGACDVFCARIEPRSYRETLTPDAAVGVLEHNATKYDPRVVAALREVVHSPDGEKILASVGREAAPSGSSPSD
ncbi:MAG: HD domain-containing phosphohydrolase [Alphaproteobacteria bacterium]